MNAVEIMIIITLAPLALVLWAFAGGVLAMVIGEAKKHWED